MKDMHKNEEPLLAINNLSLSFRSLQGKVQILRDLSLSVKKGEFFAIIGESGCGKSVTAKAITRILPEHITEIDAGEILFEGNNILDYTEKEMRAIRSNKISMIFQEPMTSLNPTFTIGAQISDIFMTQHNYSKKEAISHTIELLKKVHIPSPESYINNYPHQLSGGMQQRVMIAMALSASNPSLLIADEPTTALDVTIQAQVLSLLLELRDTMGLTILLITHDIGLVAQYADRVAIFYCGKKVEEGSVYEIFDRPSHPYTIGLLDSLPSLHTHESQHKLKSIHGSVPDMKTLGDMCPFYSRCLSHRKDICKHTFPSKSIVTHKHLSAHTTHSVYCHNIPHSEIS